MRLPSKGSVCAQDDKKPTAEAILLLMQERFKVDDVSLPALHDLLRDGAEAGWLVPEDEGAYYLREPIQTPDRPHAE